MPARLSRRTLALTTLLAAIATALVVAWALRPGEEPVSSPPRRTILLTGFGPFGGVERNPAWDTAISLHGARVGESLVHAARIEVAYSSSARELSEAIERTKADIVLSLGVAPEPMLRIETTARNRDTAPVADNAGEVRRDLPVRAGGPETIATRLPVEAVLAALAAEGFEARASDDAGGYLCNHLFYELVDRFPTERISGFVHVPPMEGAWNPERLRRAILVILEVLDRTAEAATP
jgi:pyroglutamyl-peptidase